MSITMVMGAPTGSKCDYGLRLAFIKDAEVFLFKPRQDQPIFIRHQDIEIHERGFNRN